MAEGRENRNGAEQNAEPQAAKKTIAKRLADAFMQKDYRGIFAGVYKNIIDPSLKKVTFDTIVAIVRDIIFQGSGVGAPPTIGNVDYTGYSGGSSISGSEGRREKIEEIYFRSQEEAEDVIRRMRDILRQRGILYVSDYYNIAGHTPKYTYYDCGWMNLDSLTSYGVMRNDIRYWALKLPKPIPIDRSRSNN